MGNFYTNYTLRGPSQQAVADALAGRRAMVTPSHQDCVVVFDEDSESQDQQLIAELASNLSRDFSCPVLAVLDHDDDILWYQLYHSGKLSDEYNSTPGYFGSSDGILPPSGGDALKLCTAFDALDSVEEVESILRKTFLENENYAFAFRRHADLVKALGISNYAVGTGFASFRYNEFPHGLSADLLLSTPNAPAPTTEEEKQLQRDRKFYDQLGEEDASRPCKRENCTRGAVKNSVLCRRHHFEMIHHRECPFDK